MSLFSFFSYAFASVSSAVSSFVDNIKDFFGSRKYDRTNMNDHINVDKELEEFRNKINPEVDKTEKQCMQDLIKLYDNLSELVENKFHDMAEIIDDNKRKAEKELSGTIMKYVKEHVSKNDKDLLNILEMPIGTAKSSAVERHINKVICDAREKFVVLLIQRVEFIKEDVKERLENRIIEEEDNMNRKIHEYEELEIELNNNSTTLLLCLKHHNVIFLF